MQHTTYIMGHRNPDADAICSAIAYADFKNRVAGPGHIPARCGNSNARIDAILQRFQHPLPVFLGDVTPRVRDIMVRQVVAVAPEQTCAEALELIDRHDVRVLPVVAPDGAIVGTLSVFQLGEYFLPKPKAPREMRRVHTSVNDIIRSLKAEVLNLVGGDALEDLYVRVGAMDIRSFGKFANEEPTFAHQSIIVVGDRWDIQQKSIQVGVRLLVITGGLGVDEEVVASAQERGVSLVVSPYDSATTSWIIRSATRISRLVSRKFARFGPEEKLGVVRRRIASNFAHAYMVVDEEDRLRGVFTNADLLKPVSTRLILVDHNELSQSVPGAELVSIVEIIDHHRLGNPGSQQPILFINDPVGSTCTIVADLFQRHGLSPTPAVAGILMGGIISDTLNLNSPTSTEKDARLLEWLGTLAEVTPSDLAEAVFSSGSLLLSQPPEKVIGSDFKVYEHGDLRYAVSQVEELGFGNFYRHAESLSSALAQVCLQESLHFAGLLVTDIHSQNSLFLVQGDPEVLRHISYPATEIPNVFDLPGIVSRKKQLIPYLSSLLVSLGEEGRARV